MKNYKTLIHRIIEHYPGLTMYVSSPDDLPGEFAICASRDAKKIINEVEALEEALLFIEDKGEGRASVLIIPHGVGDEETIADYSTNLESLEILIDSLV